LGECNACPELFALAFLVNTARSAGDQVYVIAESVSTSMEARRICKALFRHCGLLLGT